MSQTAFWLHSDCILAASLPPEEKGLLETDLIAWHDTVDTASYPIVAAMATRERTIPIQSPSKSKTPSLYSRMKAAGHRALSSRNENRQTDPSLDVYPQRAEPVRVAGRPSFTYDQTSRHEQSQPRPSTTQPGTRRRGEDPASSTGVLPHADVFHSQLPRASSRQHILHQAHTAHQQPSFEGSQSTYTVQPRRDSRQSQEQAYNTLNLPNHLFPQPQPSRNVLRRKPSIIADYVTESRATIRSEEDLNQLEPSLLQGKIQSYQYQHPASDGQRQTPEYPTRSLRHAGRTLVTPESTRSDSRAAKSITPSSPSTYRHDTPSVFSHASRATSRTAYSPASAMLEPQPWNTDFPVPPVPDNYNKSSTTAPIKQPKQPIIPPELAHLAFVAGQKHDAREPLDDMVPQVRNDAKATKSHYRSDFTTFNNPRHDDLDYPLRTAVATPLKAMDPALRSRVTLNSDSVKKTLASAVPRQAVAGSQANDRSARRPQGRDRTATKPSTDAIPRSSTVSASARVSIEKPRQFTRSSVERATSRLSFQCQGTTEDILEPPSERIHSASVVPQKDRPARAQLSRAFSFSRTSLKTKSSIESLKSKLNFAQRMLVKTKDQMSCVGPVDTSASMFPTVDRRSGSRRGSQSAQQTSGGNSRGGSDMAQSKQVPTDRHAMSSSSRTSFDRSRPSMTTSRLPNTVSTRDNPSRSRLDASEKATHASHPRERDAAPQGVEKALPMLPSTHAPTREVKEPTLAGREDNARLTATTDTRNSSGSDSTSTDSTTRAAPLARLNSADSGRSSVMAGYGLFPKTSWSPINRKVAPSPSHDANSTTKPHSSSPKTTKTQLISDDEMKLRRNDLALRLGALTASTSICGKILFSPVDFMIQSSPSERILVVDGSGEGE